HKKVSLRAFATQSRSMLYQNSILACFTLFAKTDCLLLLKIRSQNLMYLIDKKNPGTCQDSGEETVLIAA
ncbi:MAG: hypothetical protein ACRC0M_01320, partial [Legionella sp.]